jgi:hypothetical protein
MNLVRQSIIKHKMGLLNLAEELAQRFAGLPVDGRIPEYVLSGQGSEGERRTRGAAEQGPAPGESEEPGR